MGDTRLLTMVATMAGFATSTECMFFPFWSATFAIPIARAHREAPRI